MGTRKTNRNTSKRRTNTNNKNQAAIEREFKKLPIFVRILIIVFLLTVARFNPGIYNRIQSVIGDLGNISFTTGSGNTETSSSGWVSAKDTNAYKEVNGNVPSFTAEEIDTSGYIDLSELDNLGRCQTALACIGPETLPTEKRGEIGSVKPTGWHSVRYDDLIEDKYLYNRCHLIGFQMSGLNAEKRNLITGTRYLNVIGMLPFENEVTDYVKETNNHVMYRVTPDFHNNELVARGVYMEAYSVEDNGKGVSFNVYCYNIQPGIQIDYGTGESRREK